jgi:WXG100 family type VII secretion target
MTLNVPVLYPTADRGRTASQELATVPETPIVNSGDFAPNALHHADGSITYVTPEVIKQAATDSTTTGQEIQDAIGILQGLVASYEGRYQGVAAVEFHELMLEFNRQSDLVKVKLEDIANSLWAVHQVYTGNETQVLKNNAEMRANIPKFNL